MERLEHTLAKLWHTGPLIGQKCPNIEVNWRVDPRFASKRNLSAKKHIMSQASTRPVLRITHMLALIAFSELYITVSRQQGTFLSNRCINEMHYTYQITRRQVSSFASPRYDFASKHISRKMLHSSSFFFL